MAKTKALKSPKSEALPGRLEDTREVNPFILAEPIAKQARLVNIFMEEVAAKRDPIVDDSVVNTVNIEKISVGNSGQSTLLSVSVSFLLRGKDDGNDESLYKASCTIVLIYQCEDLTRYDQEVFKAFAGTTGVFNAWPYWREFAQNITSRMGLPPVTVPPFRFGQ